MSRSIKFLIVSIVVGAFVVLAAAGFFAYKYYTRPKPKPVVIPPLVEKTIVLPEGWTNMDISDYLVEEKITDAKTFSDALKNYDRSQSEILSKIPKTATLEGYLFPDTYRILEDATPTDIIDKLTGTFEKRFKSVTGETIKDEYYVAGFDYKLTLHEVITLASIVEKESGIDLGKLGSGQKDRIATERKTVAGIFLNRLLINKGLESDATINYITKKKDASATYKDLEVDSPYNTYKYRGLPPGPIANPSLMSIDAVLNPIKTDYYYFLHKQPSGEIVYAKTFDEHVANKNKYLK